MAKPESGGIKRHSLLPLPSSRYEVFKSSKLHLKTCQRFAVHRGSLPPLMLQNLTCFWWSCAGGMHSQWSMRTHYSLFDTAKAGHLHCCCSWHLRFDELGAHFTHRLAKWPRVTVLQLNFKFMFVSIYVRFTKDKLIKYTFIDIITCEFSVLYIVFSWRCISTAANIGRRNSIILVMFELETTLRQNVMVWDVSSSSTLLFNINIH